MAAHGQKRKASDSLSGVKFKSLNSDDGIKARLSALASIILEELRDASNDETLKPCGPAPLSIIRSHPQDVLNLAHQQMHSYVYHAVPLHWRRLYEEASIYLALHLIDKGGGPDELFQQIVRVLDRALIISGGPWRKCFIESFLLRLNDVLAERPSVAPPQRLKLGQVPVLDTSCSILRSDHTWDICDFQVHLDSRPSTPVIIPGALESWPALERWQNVSYLLSTMLDGRRLVPIEIGSSYTDDAWTQKIVTFNKFVNDYLIPEVPTEVGYLAQHDLFTQIPTLRNDISVPDYCYASPPPPNDIEGLTAEVPTTEKLEEPLVNAWLGPKGTKTPLHTDPYHNILCQVVGYKYVRLYSPAQSANLYPRTSKESGVSLANTSEVDIFHVRPTIGSEPAKDSEAEEVRAKFPLFDQAPYQEAILGPGECLYLPLGWWHYLESLSPSFSVSFWFN